MIMNIDPDSTAGGVARQYARVRSGTTPPVLRWWLDHGPYLADGPLESPDSEEYLKTCDGEEATVLQGPEELSGGYILDASPASEVCSPDLTLAATLLSAIEESTEGYDSDAESSAFEENPVGWEKWYPRHSLSPLPSSAPFPPVPPPLLLLPPPAVSCLSPSLSPSPSPSLSLPLPSPASCPSPSFSFSSPSPFVPSPIVPSPAVSCLSPSLSPSPSLSLSPLSPPPLSSSAPSTSPASSLSSAIESCEEFVSGYDSDAESSAFEEYPVGWEKWCVRPPVPPPPPSYAPYPDGLIY
ncbi:hypothetical protein L873DRAFT_1904623 [Choiromyces venosus 120613-1]|uniref:Uncharacterized protein n=1 Tax=Choiromyces venosus 120613-1 TaxID=1336337 RepID=A0A3N4JND1_9PEZI|nr:hypothetical protein L873DRAFT_1904623 [Choiromyces venosus 120613-1]